MASIKKNVIRLKTDGKKVVFDNIKKAAQINSPIKISVRENERKFSINTFEDYDNVFDSIISKLLLMNTTENNLNKIFCALENLVENYDTLLQRMLPPDLQAKLSTLFSKAKEYVAEKFKSRNTAKKRQKMVEKHECYVNPIKYSIGCNWTSKINCGNALVDHKIVQTTYQYVPITETLKSLFNNDTFSESYFNFNENRKHVCTENVFEDFCCGSIYRDSDVFTRNTIQLQLGIDDFEPCNALKTKSGLHKMCGIYMEIRNVDPKYKSKLSNIHLVALVKSQDVKENDFDKVARKILGELKLLESAGITIKCGINLKAILVDISADNLGKNGVFGFVECFVATYYCRICELTSSECRKSVEEIPEKMRRKPDYDLTVAQLNDGPPDLKQTKGVKKYCVFNDLQNFHILKNCSVDVMHDVNEGVIPFFIKFLFERLIQNKVANAGELQALCRDHNYGWFWKKYKPSLIKFERNNLNQNAMQSYCLMLNLPFILINFRPQLGTEWKAMEYLLQALQILYSTRIQQNDIERLRKLIKEHLSYLIKMGQSLLPKHHMTTHYPNLIMKMGPLIHSWMMRYESKHKVFTDLVRLTNNYKNLPLSLAKKHQARVCVNISNAFSIKSDVSKTTYDFSKRNSFDKYKELLIPFAEDSGFIRAHSFIRNCSLELRPGLILMEQNIALEILHIITFKSEYFVLCQIYNIVQFVLHLHSIEIERNNDSFKLITVSQIDSHKTYDIIHNNNRKFIIADSLAVYNDF